MNKNQTKAESTCSCSKSSKYSIEPHGDSYALYYGRCPHRHGYNLCQLSKFDSEGEQTRQIIQQALNKYLCNF